MHEFMQSVTQELGGRTLTFKTGYLAQQANAMVYAQYGETVVMATVVANEKPGASINFLPLVVDVEEKYYAAGKIGGGRFRKREGMPSTNATLAARLIDRPLRPLFNKYIRNEIQVITTILSTDFDNAFDIVALNAASAALHISDIPWAGPVAGVRVGRVAGQLILNPTLLQIEEGDLDLVVVGSKDGLLMIESGAKQVSEEDMVVAIDFGFAGIAPILAMQEELRKLYGIPKKEFPLADDQQSLITTVDEQFHNKIRDIAFLAAPKRDKERAVDAGKREVVDAILSTLSENIPSESQIEDAFDAVLRSITRASILQDKKRVDGRGPEEIRKITCSVGVLPHAHGSTVFTRGETQVMGVLTLGGPTDQQIVDDITTESERKERFLHHYCARGFSLGICARAASPKRREIGHGNLAQRALTPVLPKELDFPYTMRLVSEVLSQNGSSSMASTCASTLALMDAGVPISAPVSGIAMGLVKDGANVVILSDIQGWEDALGDMDFKVTGTKQGITALQLDMKVPGLPLSILRSALEQAKVGRLSILEIMLATLPAPRAELSQFAPRILSLQVAQSKIGMIIGGGGKTINKIIADTGVEIDISDEGIVTITGKESAGCLQAKEIIEGIIADPEVGKIYQGKVIKIMDFGAFVEILPGKEGLVHISKLSNERVERVEDVVKVGDLFPVKLMQIDAQDRLVLSKKDAEQ